jgi:peptidyl-prolyl cis-trans isomerase C
MSLLGRIAREPLLHFLVLGAALFALDGWRRPARRASRDSDSVSVSVVITAAKRAELVEEWTRVQGKPPSVEEQEHLVQSWIDEEILYREGIARGLDRGDARVRKRVAEKMGFVLEAQVVVPEPSEADLRGWFEAHRDRWAIAARVDFTHVFVKDAPDARARADSLLARLRGGEDPAALGEVFSGGRHYRGRKLDDLARAFGPDFTAGLGEQPPGEWTLRPSRHGLHLVRVDRRESARAPDFEEVRPVVREDWIAARRRDGVVSAIAAVRARWRVVREP